MSSPSSFELEKPVAPQRGGVLEVALLAYPLVLQTLAETAMHVIDSAMVGRLGTTALGAVGFAWIWLWTLLVPILGLGNGVQVFVSRHDGAGETQRCGDWLWQALWLTVPAIGLWSLALAWILPSIFNLIGAESHLRELAVSYSRARLPAGPAVAIEFAIGAFFRGLGDTRTPLRAAVVAVVINVIAAWLLIFGHCGLPALGVAGAGLAHTIGSYAIALQLMFAFARPALRERYGTRMRGPNWAAIARFLRTSAAIGGQWLLDMTTFAIFTSIVARMGAASMAASQAMLQLLSLSFMQAMALGNASGTLIGRALGAGDYAAAKRTFRSAQQLGLAVSAIVALLFVSMPRQLLGVFGDDPEFLALARPLLGLGAFFQVIDAIGIVASGSLRGAGDTRWPFMVQASLAWFLRLPVVYLGAVVLERGVFGAWSGELIYVGVLGGVLVQRFRAGHWKTIRI